MLLNAVLDGFELSNPHMQYLLITISHVISAITAFHTGGEGISYAALHDDMSDKRVSIVGRALLELFPAWLPVGRITGICMAPFFRLTKAEIAETLVSQLLTSRTSSHSLCIGFLQNQDRCCVI